jgi:hypothetical protein
LWYILIQREREVAARKSSSARPMIRLTQVASLASRHEQITVRAAFFCSFSTELEEGLDNSGSGRLRSFDQV